MDIEANKIVIAKLGEATSLVDDALRHCPDGTGIQARISELLRKLGEAYLIELHNIETIQKSSVDCDTDKICNV